MNSTNDNNVKYFVKSGLTTADTVVGRKKIWAILAIIFIVINLMLVGFAVYIHIGVEKDYFYNVESKEVNQSEFINKSTLSRVVNFFDSKEKGFSSLKAQKPINIDPSL